MKINTFYQENHQKSSFLAKNRTETIKNQEIRAGNHQFSWFPSGEP
jgi:hypothetical protein